jgi:hypothetical protein
MTAFVSGENVNEEDGDFDLWFMMIERDRHIVMSKIAVGLDWNYRLLFAGRK